MATAAPTARIMRTRKAPDADFWLIEPIVTAWYEDYVAAGLLDKAFAIPGSRVRASWAGDCAHKVALHVAGVEESDPMTVADVWRANVGTLIHEPVQRAIEKRYPGSTSEVKVAIGDVGSGHMDVWVVKPDGSTVAVEVKSVNGTGFRRMVDVRDPEGPRVKYVMQGALNAAAHDPQPDELVVAVFSLECMSPKEAAKHGVTNEFQRFSAQWTYNKEQYLDIAADEQRRLERIVHVTDSRGSDYVPRLIPDPDMPHHKVVNPLKGIVAVLDDNDNEIGTGWTWQCGYCSYQSHCAEELGIRVF